MAITVLDPFMHYYGGELSQVIELHTKDKLKL